MQGSLAASDALDSTAVALDKAVIAFMKEACNLYQRVLITDIITADTRAEGISYSVCHTQPKFCKTFSLWHQCPQHPMPTRHGA